MTSGSVSGTELSGLAAVREPHGAGRVLEQERVWSGAWHGKLFLSAMLVAAAMPIRIADGLPVINSISILDVVLMLAAVTLFLDLSFRPLDVGYQPLFLVLVIPLLLALVSIVWSHDHVQTARYVFVTAEGLVAYLFIVRELSGVSPARIVGYVERFAYLLIIPAVLLLLHVPGFEPRISDVSTTSGAYLTFFTRLSHPVLGGSNNLAGVLAFLAPILVYWGHIRHDRRFTIAGIVTASAIFMTLSRGVLLSFLIAAVVYAIAMYGQKRTHQARLGPRIAAIGVFGALAVAGFYVFNPDTHELFKDRLTLANVNARWDLISVAREEISDYPLLGVGGGASTTEPLLTEGVHNTFVQQVLYFGIPLGVFMSLILCGIAVFFFARARRTPIAGLLAYAVTVQLVSFLFEASLEGTVLRVLFYLSIGIAVALLRSVESDRSHPASAP